MIELNPGLLITPEFTDQFLSSPLTGTKTKGTYNPMQFVLRVRNDLHLALETIEPGIQESPLSDVQLQAFSTYLHETIHWWQHVGSNYGFISSLKFPVQAHIARSDLNALLQSHGAFKSIAKFDQLGNRNINVTKILNNWYDIEFAGKIALDPYNIETICKNPYFDCWGHSYSLKWASAISALGSTFDNEFSFLPNIKNWEEGFKNLRDKKIQGFYWGSPNKIPPIGTKAIFEGQARFSQLQYLYNASIRKLDINDFRKAGMLSGIYVEAFDVFLKILNESAPLNLEHPLIGLFLLVCDIAINPTDGFPFDISLYESFIITNDPGYRFVLICQMIRDKKLDVRTAIKDYSRDEYIAISDILSNSISCFSPFDSAVYVFDWINTQVSLKELLQEETAYKYRQENLPIRLFFSKFLRFQEDKFKYPQVFCWPGMNFVGLPGNSVDLSIVFELFEKHKALFIDDISGNIYNSTNPNITAAQADETLNQFFSWNSIYSMVRQWIIADGPFTFDLEWLSTKYSKEDMINWASNNFENSFGVRPEKFEIL